MNTVSFYSRVIFRWLKKKTSILICSSSIYVESNKYFISHSFHFRRHFPLWYKPLCVFFWPPYQKQRVAYTPLVQVLAPWSYSEKNFYWRFRRKNFSKPKVILGYRLQVQAFWEFLKDNIYFQRIFREICQLYFPKYCNFPGLLKF